LKRLVGRILDNAVATVPQRVAATLGAESVTFGETSRRANRMAQALHALGLRRGDRMMVWTDISLRNLDIYFAAMRLGAAYVPLNPVFSDDEAAAMADYTGPRLFVADGGHQERAAALARRLDIPLGVVEGKGTVPGADLLALAAQAADGPLEDLVEEEDIEAIFLTSGSTGKPKGVMVSHRATWNRMNTRGRNDLCGAAGEVSMFPMFHFAGWAMLLNSWVYRRPIHLVPGASAETILWNAEHWKAGVIYAIPAVWERILACRKAFDTSSLRFTLTGTSRVEPSLIERIRARIPGTKFAVMYGSTEMGGAVALDDEDIARKPYSIGLPHPTLEARIDDGELCLRGDTMMSGYYDLPDQTAAVVQDGWYRSGDLAEQDEEGYISITGRRREIIRSGGETIAPSEVEAALRDAPGIADVAVVGMPDAAWGEVVCAVVVPQPGAPPPSVEALRAHAGGRIAAFKHPRRIEIMPSLPRTPATGQIQRGAVRDSILEREKA
jgi:fatty-acyl-CoA synthase